MRACGCGTSSQASALCSLLDMLATAVTSYLVYATCRPHHPPMRAPSCSGNSLTLSPCAAVQQSIHMLGNVVASGGMDNEIKLWSLDKQPVQDAIAASYKHTGKPVSTFKSATEQFPAWSTNKVGTTRVHVAQLGSPSFVWRMTGAQELCGLRRVGWRPAHHKVNPQCRTLIAHFP